jgi:hypothetical protein
MMKIRNKTKKNNANNTNTAEIAEDKTVEDTVVVVVNGTANHAHRKLTEGEAALTARNYRLAKELVSE